MCSGVKFTPKARARVSQTRAEPSAAEFARLNEFGGTQVRLVGAMVCQESVWN